MAEVLPAETSAPLTPRTVVSANPHDKPYLLLEAWRGLASLYVVVFHFCLATVYTSLASFQPFYAFGMMGYLGVQVFFVVSGYCIASAAVSCVRKQRSVMQYFAARIRRIYPPYLAAALLTAILDAAAAQMVRSGALAHSNGATAHVFSQPFIWYFSTATLTERIFRQGQLVQQAWTLNFEVAFYLIVGLFLAWALKSGNERNFLSSLHALTILTLGWIVISPMTTFYPFSLWPEFGVGVAVYDLLANPGERQSKAAFALIILLCALVSALHDVQGYSNVGGTRIEFATVAVFGTLLAWLHRYDLSLSKNKLVAAIASIGTFSYSLYLTHVAVLAVIMQLARKFGMTPDTYPIVFLTFVPVALIAARIFFAFAERPFMSAPRKAEQALTTAPLTEHPA